MRFPLLACALLLAGCLGTSGPGPTAPPAGAAADWVAPVLVAGHDHLDPSLHAHTTPNFRLVGHDPLVSASYGTTVPGTLCGDVATKDGRRIAVAQGRRDVVATVADVTDPARPRWLGEIVMRTSYAYDVAAVADGVHVALVTSSTVRQPDQAPLGLSWLGVPREQGLWWRSACAPGWVRLQAPGEDLAPRPNALILVDIADAAQPRIADQRPLTGPGHGVSSSMVGDRVVVVATALQPVLPHPAPLSAYAQTFSFYEVQPSPTGGALVPLSTYVPPPPQEPARALDQESGHDDAWIAVHPVLQKPLAYLAAGALGILILDLSDPTQPALLGAWNDWDPARRGDTGAWHSVFAMPTLWDNGRHYIAVGPEFAARPTQTPSGVVRVLDTTDPARPVEAAAWTLPQDVVWEDTFQYSTHYLSIVGRTLFVSMYHGGVWAVDLRGLGSEPWTNLPSVGVFLATERSPAPPEAPIRWTPTAEEALALDDGSILTFDSNTGLYVVRYDEAAPMPAPRPWPLEPAGSG